MIATYFPFFVFTLLICLCTGTFVMYALWRFSGISSENAILKASRQILPVLLVCLGIASIATASHLGKPFRFLNAFYNPGSMIAQEGIWSMVFGAILTLVAFRVWRGQKVPKVFYTLGGIASFLLLLACSLVYVRAIGIPAWNSGMTIIYFFGSSILLGVAVVYAASMQQAEETNRKTMVKVALIAVAAQILVTAAFTVQLKLGVMNVILPQTVGLDIARWGIGLLAPVAISYLAWRGELGNKCAGWSFLGCVLAGEILSRLIFFMQGVHL
ncbi:hypothetical protein SRRS_32520 [Sporomusa rhizae]|uniref:dimethyl sulfoxide reductase anchor subunit family protein n=1 Tax=Sporomusa rhizae TaxID=357999 RepID=UPI00352B8D95